MKKLIVISIVAILLIAANTPPALPSSFYGSVAGARVGQSVTVSIGSIQVARTTVFLWQGQPVYALDVSMGSIGNPVKAGTMATFKVNGLPVRQAQLYSGSNRRLDLPLCPFCFLFFK